MQSVEFTNEELEVLREVLRSKIDQMDIETHRTDAHDFKEMLTHRRELLMHLLQRFSHVPVST